MKRTIAVVAVLGFVLVACGEDPGTVDSPRKIAIDAAEMSFDPNSIDITPGETIEFVITNSGALAHEFVVTNQEEIDEHLEGGHEEEAHEGEAPLEVEVDPGEAKSLVVTFDETDHMARFACLIEGHYEAGMHGDFDFNE